MDSHKLEKDCQLVSHAIAAMIRRSLREETFREKCFQFLQVTNSNDAELKLQNKLKQCVITHNQQSKATSSNLQAENITCVPLCDNSDDNSLASLQTNDSQMVNKVANTETIAVINNLSSGTNSAMHKSSAPYERNFEAEHPIVELQKLLDWNSTLTQSCSPQEIFQQDTYIPQRDRNGLKTTYNEESVWFHTDSKELEW